MMIIMLSGKGLLVKWVVRRSTALTPLHPAMRDPEEVPVCATQCNKEIA